MVKHIKLLFKFSRSLNGSLKNVNTLLNPLKQLNFINQNGHKKNLLNERGLLHNPYPVNSH